MSRSQYYSRNLELQLILMRTQLAKDHIGLHSNTVWFFYLALFLIKSIQCQIIHVYFNISPNFAYRHQWLTRLIHDLIWNRTGNVNGGPGQNVALDLVNEFLNNEFKGETNQHHKYQLYNHIINLTLWRLSQQLSSVRSERNVPRKVVDLGHLLIVSSAIFFQIYNKKGKN